MAPQWEDPHNDVSPDLKLQMGNHRLHHLSPDAMPLLFFLIHCHPSSVLSITKLLPHRVKLSTKNRPPLVSCLPAVPWFLLFPCRAEFTTVSKRMKTATEEEKRRAVLHARF